MMTAEMAAQIWFRPMVTTGYGLDPSYALSIVIQGDQAPHEYTVDEGRETRPSMTSNCIFER